MNEQYTAEFVFKTFTDIDQGRYHNAHFSHANVVMLSKEHYDRLVDAWEHAWEQVNGVEE